MPPEPQSLISDSELRRSVLAAAGATDAVAEELLAYNRNRFEPQRFLSLPALPLADEPHLEAWRAYREDAVDRGLWTVLREAIVQLRFPIRAGMSASDTYTAATRRGVIPAEPEDAEGPHVERPDALELVLHPSIAGTVPILIPGERHDFETLAQALTARNEPITVPASMGACMVSGLANWDRIRRYRRAWEAAGEGRDDEAWRAEFRALIGRKELYQDRLIILSRGPYSNVRASDIGEEESAWLEHSLLIRREHECTHYFTLRALGGLQHNLLEELIADYVGLVRGIGRFDAPLALRFLGLEAFPAFRPGGRMANYRGTPPLSDEAFGVLGTLVHAAVLSLDSFHRRCTAGPSLEELARNVITLTSLTLEELASPRAVELCQHRREALFGPA